MVRLRSCVLVSLLGDSLKVHLVIPRLKGERSWKLRNLQEGVGVASYAFCPLEGVSEKSWKVAWISSISTPVASWLLLKPPSLQGLSSENAHNVFDDLFPPMSDEIMEMPSQYPCSSHGEMYFCACIFIFAEVLFEMTS